MTKPRLLANGKSSNYGCGLSVGTRDGLTVFTHGGAVSGFIARNTFIPQTHSAVVVVINNEDGPLANAIVDHALKAIMPARSAAVPVTTGPSAAREDRGEIPRGRGPYCPESVTSSGDPKCCVRFYKKSQSFSKSTHLSLLVCAEVR
jgi:hypothetical protein